LLWRIKKMNLMANNEGVSYFSKIFDDRR